MLAFDLRCDTLASSSHTVLIQGGVDNKATDALSRRGLTTKSPVMFVLMEYLHQSDIRGLRCELSWRPRLENSLADELTNLCFDSFDLSRRVDISWEVLELPILKAFAGVFERVSEPGGPAVS